MARLVFRDSQGREGTVELSISEPTYVGRGLECAIRTDDGMVSRRHSQITMENGRYVIEDLGSANGTHLNNTRIQKQALGHADVVQCGSLMIRFLDEGGVNVVPQGRPAQQPTPPQKKGGTMVLERPSPSPLATDRAPAMPMIPAAPAPNMPYGGPPQMPVPVAAAPYGGPPAMPAPQNGPPAMPPPLAPLNLDGPASTPLPYGGPPEMPSAPAAGRAAAVRRSARDAGHGARREHVRARRPDQGGWKSRARSRRSKRTPRRR